MFRLKFEYLFLVILFTLLFKSQAETDCKDKLILSARLSVVCCNLTRPSLDSGYNDCLQEIGTTVPLTRKLTKKEAMAIAMCVEECNYIGNGYINADPPYILDMQMVEQNLNKIFKSDQVAIDYLLSGYKTCDNFQKHHEQKMGLKFEEVDFVDSICSPYALQITSCLRVHAMQSCPNEYFSKSKLCKEARDFFVNCLPNFEKTANT